MPVTKAAAYSFVDAIKKAVPNWDPSKHPRDRDGQFIETGDYVRAYAGKDAVLHEAIGKVVASYYDVPTNRMFIGIDVGSGQLKWYRPKQLEHIKVKAKLQPKLPLPALDSKEPEVHWDNYVNESVPDVITALGDNPDMVSPLPAVSKMAPADMKAAGLEHVPEGSVAEQTGSSTAALPKGKTPEQALGLMVTSFENKYQANTGVIYPGGVAGYKADFADMLADPDFDSAAGKLKKLMTAAKLGGKQRKRYLSFLEQKHGGSTQAMEVVGEPTIDPEVVPAEPSVLTSEPWGQSNDLGSGASVTQSGDGGYQMVVQYADGGTDTAKFADKYDAIGEATKLLQADLDVHSGYSEWEAQVSAEGVAGDEYDVGDGIQAFKDGVSPADFAKSVMTDAGVDAEGPVITGDPFVDAQNWASALEGYNGASYDHYNDIWNNAAAVDKHSVVSQIVDVAGAEGTDEAGQKAAWKFLMEKYAASEGSDVTMTDLDYAGVPGFAGMAEFDVSAVPPPLPPQPDVNVTDPTYIAMVNAYMSDLASGDNIYVEAVAADDGSIYSPLQIATAKQAIADNEALAAAEAGVYDSATPPPKVETPKWPGPADIGPYDSVYKHPQGSVIVVNGLNATVTKYKPDGKKASTSSTAENLQDDHGAWTYVGTGPSAKQLWEVTSTPAPAAPAAVVPKPAKKAAKKVAKPAPVAPPMPQTVDPPTTPQYQTLKLLVTSMTNKGLWDSQAVDDWNTVSQNGVSYEHAAIALAKLMTKAKLGGKQRKRYKDALAEMHGKKSEAPVLSTPTPPPGSTKDKWRLIGPAPTHTMKIPGVVGATAGNELVNPGGGITPQKAKRSIQDELSKRMAGKVTTEQLTKAVLDTDYAYTTEIRELAKAVGDGKAPSVYKSVKQETYGNWALSTSPYGGKPLTQENLEFALRSTVANSLIKLWAQTSNDSNVRSLAMQEAAVEEFGLTDTYKWSKGNVSKAKVQKELDTQRDLFRTFLRAMYDHTQEWGKKNGVTHVRLRRGSGTYAGPVGSTVTVQLRPMSSFSTNKATANGFGTNRIDAIVPIEWIIGTAATGFGCQNEYEWVVLGGTHTVRVSS